MQKKLQKNSQVFRIFKYIPFFLNNIFLQNVPKHCLKLVFFAYILTKNLRIGNEIAKIRHQNLVELCNATNEHNKGNIIPNHYIPL